jgi:hypothetical protein
VPQYVYYLGPDETSVICRPFDNALDQWSKTINLRRDGQWESKRGNVFGTAEEANKDNDPKPTYQ